MTTTLKTLAIISAHSRTPGSLTTRPRATTVVVEIRRYHMGFIQEIKAKRTSIKSFEENELEGMGSGK